MVQANDIAAGIEPAGGYCVDGIREIKCDQFPVPPQQKTVEWERAIVNPIVSDDIASSVDPDEFRLDGAGEIKRGKLVAAQYIAMHTARDCILSHDHTLR